MSKVKTMTPAAIMARKERTVTEITYVWNLDQGEWKRLALVDSPTDGRYFYRVHAEFKEGVTGPVARRLMVGGPVEFNGEVYSQHAPGKNVFD